MRLPARRQAYLVKPLDLLDAEGEQLFRLQLCSEPMLWRLEVSPTCFTPEYCKLLLDALCDVHLGADAVHTHILRDAQNSQVSQQSTEIRASVESSMRSACTLQMLGTHGSN